MDYQKVLDEIVAEIALFNAEGKVATYIPELGNVDPNKFGIYLQCTDGKGYATGDALERFSIQSISKVLSLSLALKLVGNHIWTRIGVEPSGDPFNSLVQLEYEKGIPRNPFINAGALVVADILMSELDNPKEELLQYVRDLAEDQTIEYNHKVAASEMEHKYRNAALTHLMKDFGNIKNDVNEVLDFYFHQCAIAMNCKQLAQAFTIFLNYGKYDLSSEAAVLDSTLAKRINALMLTCGFYDESGEFAFSVGLPGKSGVGGGIVALHPKYYSIAVWSPPLNSKGNSELGLKALELLTTKTEQSVF
ncbi:glutaminase [Leeuwenhoekiella sp. W20_SRS_FM14]|uniref:glutaminase n=1 Tax=Leeuwenhoekiella sp. W20_SRS_FM14 TaxID=3240270 RepID=UPI003F9D187A